MLLGMEPGLTRSNPGAGVRGTLKFTRKFRLRLTVEKKRKYLLTGICRLPNLGGVGSP